MEPLRPAACKTGYRSRGCVHLVASTREGDFQKIHPPPPRPCLTVTAGQAGGMSRRHIVPACVMGKRTSLPCRRGGGAAFCTAAQRESGPRGRRRAPGDHAGVHQGNSSEYRATSGFPWSATGRRNAMF